MRFRVLSFKIPDVHALPVERPDTPAIDWQLEDQVFKYLMPNEYRAISRLVRQKRGDRETYTGHSVSLLREALRDAEVDATVYGRTKHLYSIYQKLRCYHARGRNFRDIYDLTALRVIVDSVEDCYYALGVVHQNWRPVFGRFDDYIASPKKNRYRSLHTSVIGEEGHRLEVQIRTKEMHRVAEGGVASHLSYKQKEPDRRPTRPQQESPHLEQLFERQRPTSRDWERLEA
jgi:GTP pyrophosphokinase